MENRFHDAVVGAGILGLAHAYHLAKHGRRVVVFERHPQARGASIRNFGMLWPIGQPFGEMRALAERSVSIWKEVLRASRIWHDECGSLHLAYHPDEWQILNEFHEIAAGHNSACRLLNPQQTREMSRLVQHVGLQGSLWSPYEVCVDPREAVGRFPEWLQRTFGVQFQFGAMVTNYDGREVQAGGKKWLADRLWICSGDELQTLYPGHLQSLGLIRCKLQMMRTRPLTNDKLGPMLAAGLTLRRYLSFRSCPSLPRLQQRVARECPALDEFGIHVLVSQHGTGELTLGDSHQYGEHVSPFDVAVIDDLILQYLQSFLNVPDMQISQRWQGVYLKHPSKPYSVSSPDDNVVAILGVGGNGMTLSFGLAEQVVDQWK